MTVWIVGIADCEGNSIVAVCATKQLAEREIFKVRDKLVREWKEAHEHQVKSIAEFCAKEKTKIWEDEMYPKMVANLSGDDYAKWDNYPHDTPYLYEAPVVDNV